MASADGMTSVKSTDRKKLVWVPAHFAVWWALILAAAVKITGDSDYISLAIAVADAPLWAIRTGLTDPSWRPAALVLSVLCLGLVTCVVRALTTKSSRAVLASHALVFLYWMSSAYVLAEGV